MLPFDNKNEFQILIDLPEGSTVEQTDSVLSELANHVRSLSEVKEVISYAGTSSPIDFNGMVRHYYLRQESNRGDLRVNLIAKEEREQQSHAIVLRLRNELQAIVDKHNARMKIVEVPPGPPVLSTLVAEVYPHQLQSEESHRQDTLHVRNLFAKTKNVVDVDDTFEAQRDRYIFQIDKEKASLTGISAEQISNTIRIGLQGMQPGEGNVQDFRAGAAHLPRELNPLSIVMQLPLKERGRLHDLLRLGVKSPRGEIIQIGELGRFVKAPAEQTIYHKNLRRVAYV
jgi:multidrug efflux pump subunit AcrB